MARLVIVGAGLTGLRAAEAARRFGFTGEISLIGAERHLPYDRPPLSKEFLTARPRAEDPPTLRGADTLAELGVELRLGATATGLDAVHRLIRVDIGGTDIDLAYDALLIATGSRARSLPGTEHLTGVHTLRTVDDARQIRSALDAGARTIVVGAGFIGSEVAASASRRGAPVTVLEALPVPLAGAVGPELGKVWTELHERNGVRVRCDAGVAAIEGDHGQVQRVRLVDGTVLPADLVVVGIGAVPNTGWLATSGLEVADGVVCDQYLAAGKPGVYAAGDVVRFANPVFGGAMMRLEHWTTAAEQAVAAARNVVAELAGEPRSPFGTVPYFWSDCYESRIQFVGVPSADEIQVVVGGEAATGGLLAVYRTGDRLTGAFGVHKAKLITLCRRLIGEHATWNEALHALAG
ncbi:MAG TPA: FAD-dependent oxidoreductase [Pseudonocardiaceae bacterium]|nr:FAD-dependent oxidoreductase [Pseudonocardiaceae bacterium]